MFLVKALPWEGRGGGSGMQEGTEKVGENGQVTLKTVPSLLISQINKIKGKT